MTESAITFPLQGSWETSYCSIVYEKLKSKYFNLWQSNQYEYIKCQSEVTFAICAGSQFLCNLMIFSHFLSVAVHQGNFVQLLGLKVLVPIHSLIPQLFLNIWRFWYQKLSHIQKALCVKFYAQSWSSLGEINKKPLWKLENVVSTIYKKQ